MTSEMGNNQVQGQEQEIKLPKTITYPSNRTSLVNVKFRNLTYKIGEKSILNSISGQFCAGELTAILGASGAGKTTLLKVLSGHLQQNVAGTILIKNQNEGCVQSAYVTDDVALQPFITAQEAMTIPAELKLNNRSNEQRQVIIESILSEMCLTHCSSTRTEYLSGGEKKRLTIALELINNPSIMFFDEPTSGLDAKAAKNCIEVLKRLAEQGRTIVCTIHQPSISILQQFNQVYFMLDGMCLYNGSTDNIISYLEKLNFPCSLTWNPADHIIEMAQMSGECKAILVASIKNGRRNERSNVNGQKTVENHHRRVVVDKISNNICANASFCTQFSVILRRMFLQQIRNRLALFVYVFCYTVMALSFGAMFYNIGNVAEMVPENSKLYSSSMLAVTYIQVMIPLFVYRRELKLLSKEYSNKWYGLNAYYSALTLRSIPLMVITIPLFLVISLKLTGQSLDLNRFLLCFLIFILLSIGSEGLGIIANTLFRVKDGIIISMAIMFLCFLFSLHKADAPKSINKFERILMDINFMQNAQVCLFLTEFKDRPPLECTEPFCYYSNTNNFLKTIGYADKSLVRYLLGLTVCVIALRLGAYLALKYRLSHVHSKYFHEISME